MQDKPTDRQLLQGVAYFLEDVAMQELEGAAQFRARVASNVVKMLLREWESPEADLHVEHAALCDVLDRPGDAPPGMEDLRARVLELNEELTRRIRAGEADAGAFRARVLAHLRAAAVRKLEVANPRMAAVVRKELSD